MVQSDFDGIPPIIHHDIHFCLRLSRNVRSRFSHICLTDLQNPPASHTVSTSGAGANCMLYDVVRDPRSDVLDKLVSDHAGFEGSAAFFKESINRPTIIGRNLRAELH